MIVLSKWCRKRCSDEQNYQFINNQFSMKIAIVHDYLYQYGGAERVLEALHEMYPEAPVYTAWVDWEWVKKDRPEWSKWEIKPSWFQQVPFRKQLTSPLRFLAPYVWESFDLSQFEVVISSAAWFITKGVITRSEAFHVCYCHTPPRYLYGLPISRKRSWITDLYAGLVNPFLRKYDFVAAQRVDQFVANSENVRRRIQKFYRRDSVVVYPPVQLQATSYKLQAENSGSYFLMVNRLVGPKRVDVAVSAAKQAGVKLKIVGTGPEEGRLRQLIGENKNVELLGYMDDHELARLYAGCKAVIYLGEEEDFGITPVEAMSFGKPVIGAKSGGIVETVNEKTGILLDDVSPSSLAEALAHLHTIEYDSEAIKKYARRFSKEEFKKRMKEVVETGYNQV